MVTPSSTDQVGIRARQIPQAVRFLRTLGVPATRIAGILGQTADNIRHIDARAYARPSAPPAPISLEVDDLKLLTLTEKQRQAQVLRNLQGLRLRTKQDLDQTEATVWSIVHHHQSVGLDLGYEALLAIRPSVANARHGHAVRVRLLIEEKLAWFALPLDRIETAFAHAQVAMNFAIEAFRESAGDKRYLLRYGEAALIASICLQKLDLPARSFVFIQAADEANRAAGKLPGSEHLRQRGVSYLRLGPRYDDRAKKAFTRAPIRMEKNSEAQHPVDLKMNGLRQRAFLNPKTEWETVQELVSNVADVYGNKSMQFAVAARSTALVGLKIAAPKTNEVALALLDSISPLPFSALRKGVPHVLSMTPELGLQGEALDLWLRFAMNVAPFPPHK